MGLGIYVENDIEYVLRKGTFFCSRPGFSHQIKSNTGIELLFVAFEVIENQSTHEEAQRFQALSKEAEVCIHFGLIAPTMLLWKTLLIPENQEWALRPEQLPLLAQL